MYQTVIFYLVSFIGAIMQSDNLCLHDSIQIGNTVDFAWMAYVT